MDFKVLLEFDGRCFRRRPRCMVNPPFLTVRTSSGLTFYRAVVRVNVNLAHLYLLQVKGTVHFVMGMGNRG